MNPDFNRLLAASAEDRRDLFLATAVRLGTTVQNVEKDFWVCWALDALFNGLQPGGPPLLFKGGTSLSKGYGLTERFSEDIDITVFRADIDAEISIDALEKLSRKQRERQLDAIRTACQAFLSGPIKTQLDALSAGLPISNVCPSRCRNRMTERSSRSLWPRPNPVWPLITVLPLTRSKS